MCGMYVECVRSKGQKNSLGEKQKTGRELPGSIQIMSKLVSRNLREVQTISNTLQASKTPLFFDRSPHGGGQRYLKILSMSFQNNLKINKPWPIHTGPNFFVELDPLTGGFVKGFSSLFKGLSQGYVQQAHLWFLKDVLYGLLVFILGDHWFPLWETLRRSASSDCA